MRLLEYIKASNDSVSALARKIGCSRYHLWRVAHGERNPSSPLAQKIIAATGGAVTLDDLLAASLDSESESESGQTRGGDVDEDTPAVDGGIFV